MSLPEIDVIASPSLSIPAELSGLQTLAQNVRWTWRPSAKALFVELFGESWAPDATPLAQLSRIQDWTPFLSDETFVGRVKSEVEALDQYLGSQDTWWNRRGGKEGLVAYFCAEYSFHETMNQYAGGLGILAGDHLKEASDLGLPLVGIGLFYRRGFFHQIIDFSGRQEASYPSYSPQDLGLHRAKNPETGEGLSISLPLPARVLEAAVWILQVGRTPLILLDTDVEANSLPDRKITSQLYTGGREMRLLQEFVLGAGGVKALTALGIEPTCCHLNEGHSAFLLLERMAKGLRGGKTLKEAKEAVRSTSVLTIHTPVPEGNERFGSADVSSLIQGLCDEAGINAKDVLAAGIGADEDPAVFDMTAFALRHTRQANGVSLLHGKTADKTWRQATKTPVGAVTNGVHMPTWLGPKMTQLYSSQGLSLEMETLTGADESVDRPVWPGASTLDDAALWAAHLEQKKALIEWAKTRLYHHHARLGEGASQLETLLDALDPEALLIGFARRFATYKRAGLLFTDLKRITKLMNTKGRKIQVLFAGKSHPHDRGGQALIEKVYKATQSSKLKGKVFLLEDYDMECGRMLVQGVDLWLNNPRRPLEASGTSGMKAAANGIPNLSILDGWWDEAFVSGAAKNGWAIGGRTLKKDTKEQDAADAEALYGCLEKDVIPAFFDHRDDAGVPRSWTKVMKEAIATSAYSFSTARMLRDYVDQMYFPLPKSKES
jgi:glycogen phosphorylase